LGGEDQEDHISRSAQGNSILIKKKLDVVVRACHASYMGSINRMITVQAGPGLKVIPYLKNN
jgi:hypothetical protein